MILQPQVALLIPTRNRPEKVTKLLDSVCNSFVCPQQIVIVASGEDILPAISTYKNKLNITYVFSEVAGQVNQKKLGLEVIEHEIDWVAFLDDDVIVCPETFSSAFETIESLESIQQSQISGVGFRISSTSRVNRWGKLSKLIAKVFLLYSDELGVVLRSGQATSYQESEKPIYTQWLNGVSMWRREISLHYLYMELNSGYAACEDLIFSYQESKGGNLIFLPNSKVYFQDSELTDFDNIGVLRSASYNRFSFVLSHKELSKWLCAWSQIGRSIYAIKTARNRGVRNFRLLFRLNIEIFLACLQPDLLKKFSEKSEERVVK